MKEVIKGIVEVLVVLGMFTVLFLMLWFFTTKDLLEIFAWSAFGSFFTTLPILIYVEGKVNGK